MVYLAPFLSYLAGSKGVSAHPPVRPEYDDKYRSRSYRFVDRQKVDIDVISGAAVDYVGMDVHEKKW